MVKSRQDGLLGNSLERSFAGLTVVITIGAVRADGVVPHGIGERRVEDERIDLVGPSEIGATEVSPLDDRIAQGRSGEVCANGQRRRKL